MIKPGKGLISKISSELYDLKKKKKPQIANSKMGKGLDNFLQRKYWGWWNDSSGRAPA
jgi:hypothetical protein